MRGRKQLISSFRAGIALRLHKSRAGITVARLRLQRANGGEWPGEEREVGKGTEREVSGSGLPKLAYRPARLGLARCKERVQSGREAREHHALWRARVLTQCLGC
jgi:hypothetical protein